MKNRSDAEAIRAYSKIYDEITSKGLKLKFQTMDNESSTALKQFLHSKDIQFQLVPPHVHRQNAAERAIQTFKNHFVAMLFSTDKQFPIHLWDRLIPQAVITLNLLRQSRLNPKLSAHAQLHGLFDYNKTPLAPPGTKVIIHEKPDRRGSWSLHGLKGCYVSDGTLPSIYSILFHNWARKDKRHGRFFPQALQGARALQCRYGDDGGIGPHPCLEEPGPNHTIQTVMHGQNASNKKVSGNFRINGARKDASGRTHQTENVHTADTKGADTNGTDTKGARKRHI
jgi:hypothetical protein